MKMNSWSHSLSIPRITLLSSLAVLLLLISYLASTTAYNTLSGDDMVFTKTLTNPNPVAIFESISQNYTHWTARISNILTLNLLFSIVPGEVLVHLTLLVSLGLLTGSLWYLFSNIFRSVGVTKPRISALIIGLVLTLSMCLFSATPYENFYWMAGVVTYVIPLALFCFIIGYVIKASQKKYDQYNPVRLSLLLLLTIIMGLYNEAFILQCLALMLFLTLILFAHKDKSLFWGKYKTYFITLFIGLCVAALIVKLSPGTAYRSNLNASLAPGFDHSFFFLLKMSVKTTLKELHVFASYNLSGLITTFIGSLCVSMLLPTMPVLRKHALYIIAFFSLAPLISFFVLAFGIHYAYQPDISPYSLLTANFFSYLSISVIAITISQFFYRKSFANIKIFLPVGFLVFLASLLPIVQHITDVRRSIILQQSEFQETNNLILKAKSKGASTVNIGISEKFFSYCVPENDTHAWCNNANQQYYGMRVISADKYVNHDGIRKLQEGKLK